MLVLAMQFSRSFAITARVFGGVPRRRAVRSGLGRGDVHAAPADPQEAAWRPLLQNGIVMTAEPQLGLPTLETTHRGASAVTNRLASDRRGSLRYGHSI